jgi:hypothetical protein
MLWTAGQDRMARERTDRLAELFVAARDADLDVGVSTGRLTARGAWSQPSYLSNPDGQRQTNPNRGLRQLMADFPGNVAPGREFTQ